MSVNLNPVAPTPVPPATEAPDGGVEHGPAGPGGGAPVAAPALTTAEQLVARHNVLEALLESNLQGSAAIDAPEMAQQQASARDAAARSTAGDASAQRASAMLASALSPSARGDAAALGGNLAQGTQSQAPIVEPAQRIGATATDLTLPVATASAAGLISDNAAPVEGQPTLIASTISSLVAGQPQTVRLAGLHDDTRIERRDDDRDRRRRHHDGSALFDDDLPEQLLRDDNEAHRAPHASRADVDDDPDGDAAWPIDLARRLGRERSGSAGSHALALSLSAWARARAVLFVCPTHDLRGDDGLGLLVWACVPERVTPASAMQASSIAAAAAASRVEVPALRGQRFAARLHWKQGADMVTPRADWWAVRAVKQHGVALSRQLRTTALDDADGDHVARHGLHTDGVAIQLGPVLLPLAREWDLRVRIDAVQRVWTALRDQWSVLVVACSEPLLATRARAH